MRKKMIDIKSQNHILIINNIITMFNKKIIKAFFMSISYTNKKKFKNMKRKKIKSILMKRIWKSIIIITFIINSPEDRFVISNDVSIIIVHNYYLSPPHPL